MLIVILIFAAVFSSVSLVFLYFGNDELIPFNKTPKKNELLENWINKELEKKYPNIWKNIR